MTELPSPQPTQVRRPWRATVRTMFATLIGTVLPMVVFLPDVIRVSGLDRYAWAAGLIVAVGSITRVMAIPAVNAWLTKIGLGATPK